MQPPARLLGVILASLALSAAGAQARVGRAELEAGIALPGTRLLVEAYAPGAPPPAAGDSRFREPDPRRLPRPEGSGRFSYSFATEFILEESNGPLNLYLGPCDYPFELFLNGHDLFQGGRAEKPYSSSIFNSFAIRLPESLLKREGSPNALILRLLPMEGDEDYPPPPFILLEPSRAVGKVFLRNFLRVDLVRAASFTALVLALYFFVLSASRRGGKSYLLFALLCLSFASSYAEISLQSEAISELLVKKLSKIGFLGMLYFFPAFIMAFTGRPRRPRPWLLGMGILALGFTLLFLFQPSKVSIDRIFGLVMMIDFGLGMSFGLIILGMAAFKDRTPGAALLLMSAGLVIAASGLDLVSIFSGSLPYAYLTPYGFLSVVITIFVVLARDQARLSDEALRRAAEIEEDARFQAELVDKVSGIAAKLLDSSRELEEGMTRANRLIAESASAAETASQASRERAREAGRVVSLLSEQIERSSVRIPEAMSGQSSFVGNVAATLSAMNERIALLADQASGGAAAAEGLAQRGDSAARAVAESRAAAASIAASSQAVREILAKIEDLAEKTNTLAINTAIEAARAGQSGKGFAVIAQAIRALAIESGERLRVSTSRLGELEEAVRRNESASTRVDEGLAAIIAAGRDTSRLIGRISTDILARREESARILAEAERLRTETRSLEEYLSASLAENDEARGRIAELAAAFGDTERLLAEEAARVESLESALGAARRAAAGDREAVDLLNGLLRNRPGAAAEAR